jgi:PAB-dependent poly(A)-specific ribonuclease subunit 3
MYLPESMADTLGLSSNHEANGPGWIASRSGVVMPSKQTLQAIGITEPIRQHFRQLDIESLRQMDPDDERYKEIPSRYHSAYPLDDLSVQRGAGGTFGYPACLYKVIDQADGSLYALRRFDNVRPITPSVLKNAQSKWTSMQHPSIVALHSIVVERGALFFSHSFHPGAQSLRQRFFDPRSSTGSPVTEALLWRLLSQLIVGVRAVHINNMAVRSITVVHILVTSGCRFRLGSAGVLDVLEFESRKTLQDLQLEDLAKLGFVILSVAAKAIITPKSLDTGLARLQANFSQELCGVVTLLIGGSQSVNQICEAMAGRICEELDVSMTAHDSFHLNLRGEYENGRILRLLLKLGLINERPESTHNPSWSETGERYILQLFRDYLFHQTDLNGSPQIDLGHVLISLNKLDRGDPEQLILSSRDGKDMLVVSYGDVRRYACCIDISLTSDHISFLNRCMEASISDLYQQQRPHAHALSSG